MVYSASHCFGANDTTCVIWKLAQTTAAYLIIIHHHVISIPAAYHSDTASYLLPRYTPCPRQRFHSRAAPSSATEPAVSNIGPVK